MNIIWSGIRHFEELIFVVPFILFAKAKHIRYSFRCITCGRLMLGYYELFHCSCRNCERNRLLELGEKEFAHLYESDWLSKRYIPNPDEEHIYSLLERRIDCGNVLDVGCGQGNMLKRLITKECKLIGIDISKTALTTTAQQCGGQVNLNKASAEYIPLKGGSLDFVICTEVLEHTKRPKRVIIECHRVLKEDSVAFFVVPNGKGIFGDIPQHIHKFSLKKLTKLLCTYGFKVHNSGGFGLYIPLVTHLLSVLSQVTGKDLKFAGPIKVRVPEFMSVSLYAKCLR